MAEHASENPEPSAPAASGIACCAGLTEILADRAARLSWVRRQQSVSDADIEGLREIGIRYGVRQIPGEDKEDFRGRYCLIKLCAGRRLRLRRKRQRIAYVLDSDDFQIVAVYRAPGRALAMKSAANFSGLVGCSYAIWTYYILIPDAVASSVRASLIDAITQ